MYDDVTVYYSTGTGNSYRVTIWISDLATEAGAAARVESIEEASSAADPRTGPRSLVGLVFPTHAFTAPWAVVQFALALPNCPGTHAFLVATRGGMKLGSLFVPGFEGTGCLLLALILMLKGYAVRGTLGADMPANWLVIHPGFSESSAEAIVDRCRPRVVELVGELLAGRRRFGNPLVLLLGLVLSPLSLGYLVWGRRFLAKLFFASDRCTGCGICATSCPRGAIRLTRDRRGGNPRPYWSYTCESCMRCMGYCPERAIEASYSWAYILYNLTTVPAGAYLLRQLGRRIPAIGRLKSQPLEKPLQLGYNVGAVYLAYHVFSAALRIPAINRFFTLTTPTHYYRRYHAAGTSVDRLARHQPGREP